ncbi:hypothetical protein PR048_016045 [Dryococelus australis]|uniref:Uncharacterized protein n=1 Tax=Dryococelus australis TaxID=614101 RepID=A0ABQ9HIM8_9NEOP|nr:hypothetical protein PR048_016045 [Dryococelus australis]
MVASSERGIDGTSSCRDAANNQKALIQLRRADPLKKLVFMSCDAKAAFKNFVDFARSSSKTFQGLPFVPVRAVAVDMFPHTVHCELVVVFERLDLEARDAGFEENPYAGQISLNSCKVTVGCELIYITGEHVYSALREPAHVHHRSPAMRPRAPSKARRTRLRMPLPSTEIFRQLPPVCMWLLDGMESSIERTDTLCRILACMLHRYTNIPHSSGLSAIEYYLKQRPPHSKLTIAFLVELSRLTPSKNFIFQDSHYL